MQRAKADIQVELVKLSNGDRLLRLFEPLSGLAMERKLDANKSVHDQKLQLVDVFQTALKRAEVTA